MRLVLHEACGDAERLRRHDEAVRTVAADALAATGEVEDDLGSGVDLSQANVGFGYHTAMSETVDFVANLSYEYIELSDTGISIDENGLGLGLGMRFAATDRLEIDGGIDYVEYDSLFGDRTSLRTNFLYSFTDNITVGLGGKWGDDVTEYALTGRFYFAQ